MRKIIMVNGKKRSGKDYTSDMFVDKGFIKLSIAMGLKDRACKIAGIDFDTMEELKNEELSFEADDGFKERFKDSLYLMNNDIYNSDDSEHRIDILNVGSIPFWNSDGTVDARKFLQNMNVFKDVFKDDNIWINLLIHEIKVHHKGDIIIADFRFPNEHTSMVEAFGKITTMKVIGKNYYDVDKYDNHSSETSLNDWKFDYHFNNTIWHSGVVFWQVQGLLQTLDIEEGK